MDHIKTERQKTEATKNTVAVPSSCDELWAMLSEQTRREMSSTQESEDKTILAIAAGLGVILIAICEICKSIDTGYRRKALLRAYRLRHKWRKADVAKLRLMGAARVAEPWLEKLERSQGRRSAGKGVIRYQPLEAACGIFFQITKELTDPSTGPRRRLAVLRQTPLCPLITEAVYRGEYALLRRQGAKSPFEMAEHNVAEALGLSAALARKHCTRVRRVGPSPLDAATVNDLLHWAKTADIRVFMSKTNWDIDMGHETALYFDSMDRNLSRTRVLS